MDTYFHNECKKRVLDFFVIEGLLSRTGDFGELLNKSYRGFKEIADGELVAVFDITSFLNIPLRTSKNPVWMILDDFTKVSGIEYVGYRGNSIERSYKEFENPVLSFSVLHSKDENGSQATQAMITPVISPKVLQFFGENTYMKQIRDPLNNLVETPKSMYLYDQVRSRFMKKSEKSEWLEPRSFHPIYGNFYYLKALNNVGSFENPRVIESYRKCAVFLNNYADFLEKPPIKLSEINITEQKEKQDNLMSGGNNSDKLIDLELSDDEEEPYNYTNEYDKQEIQNNLPFVSLIMFSEKGEHIYCIKTESIFAEL